MAPVSPREPGKPVGPVAPSIPVDPIEPVAPCIPIVPVAPVAPMMPVGPASPVAPCSPVGPCKPPYGNKFQGVIPSPILNKLVSVSNPISPAARVGFAAVQSAAIPRLNCN